MKTNIFKVIILCCCLLLPQTLLAEGKQETFNLTQRAQKILQQAPKTAEELLQIIKIFLENPDMNGYELGEKVSGVDRKYWTLVNQEDNWRDIDIKWKDFVIAPELPVYKKSIFGWFSLGIFQDGRVLCLWFSSPESGTDPQKNLTAAKLLAVLGKAKRVKFYRRATEFHRRYQFYYWYHTEQYDFVINFYPEDKRLIESGTLECYETHKDIPAYYFYIKRTTNTALPTHK